MAGLRSGCAILIDTVIDLVVVVNYRGFCISEIDIDVIFATRSGMGIFARINR